MTLLLHRCLHAKPVLILLAVVLLKLQYLSDPQQLLISWREGSPHQPTHSLGLLAGARGLCSLKPYQFPSPGRALPPGEGKLGGGLAQRSVIVMFSFAFRAPEAHGALQKELVFVFE